MLKKISIDKLVDLMAAFMERESLYAPVKGKEGVNFQEIINPSDVTLDYYNTILSPKSILFPRSEDMIKYILDKEGAKAEVVPIDAKPRIVFGIRPCDAKSFDIMDRHFLGAGIIDPYWKNRRDNTTVIGYAFDPETHVAPADFYNTLGITASDTEGSDIFMILNNGMLFLNGITEKGNALLGNTKVLQEALSDDEKVFEEVLTKSKGLKTRFADIEHDQIAKKIVDIFKNDDFWKEITATCLSCGVCTYVCPTCYCFDINDETLFNNGIRRRFWDACMFTDFTMEASGHNPRPQIFQRYRQKVGHKYSYHVEKYGCISCVGCGRCTRSCPVNIDIFTIVDKISKL